jgi:hypothetical protein
MPILDNCFCWSNNIIYCIYCIKCRCYYIGESKRTAKERIREHLNKIKNYTLFNDLSSLTEVSKHFFKDHNLKQDFRFNILRKDIEDTSIRKNMEMDLLNVMISLGVAIINERKVFEDDLVSKEQYDYKLKNLFFA